MGIYKTGSDIVTFKVNKFNIGIKVFLFKTAFVKNVGNFVVFNGMDMFVQVNGGKEYENCCFKSAEGFKGYCESSIQNVN